MKKAKQKSCCLKSIKKQFKNICAKSQRRKQGRRSGDQEF